MSTPFYKYGLFGDETSLIVAFLIGSGFGFFLERAGFGSARKLAAQFYFSDMAVFKVMFTAIVTALLGATYLGWLGVLDLSLVYLAPTYLWPQVAGGLLLGIGFVVGGYCPGTSVVAVSTGRIDGLFYGAGIAAGVLVFSEAFPRLQSLYESGFMGAVTLPELLHVSHGVLTFGVVLVALSGFWAAEQVERAMRRRLEAQR